MLSGEIEHYPWLIIALPFESTINSNDKYCRVLSGHTDLNPIGTK